MAYLSAEETLDERRKFEKMAAEALAGLAHVLMIDYLRGWNNATNINILVAEQAVQKALALDASVAIAHVAKGQIREVKGDLPGAIAEFDEALAFDRHLVIANAHKANAVILLGRAEDALEPLETAIRRGADLGLLYWFKGRAYFNMGASSITQDYDKAIHWLRQSIDSLKTSHLERPATWFSLAHLISAYAWTGQLQKHEREAELAVEEYRERFIGDWPLDRIRDYYTQPKYHYRNALPQLDEALQKYYEGLEISQGIFGVPKKN